MRKTLKGWEGDILVRGKKICILRYADDITIFVPTEKEMSELLNKIEKEIESVDLYINKVKTKIMVIDRAGQLTRRGKLSGLEMVQAFVYLGSLLTSEGGCTKEIRRTLN